jgi:hypothetical protein
MAVTQTGRHIEVRIDGDRPLLMHNGQLANPLYEWTKALRKVTSKSKKTDEDHIEIARLEFMGGLYYERALGVFVPGINIEGCILAGAKIKRRGPKVLQGLSCVEDRVKLIYDGPRTPDELWAAQTYHDVRGVKLQRDTTTMRCRPIFRTWGLGFTLRYYPDVIDPADIREALDDAGLRIGIGDYHHRFGTFHVTGWEVQL